MTKEQILAKQPSIQGNMDDVLIEHGDCLDAMEDYANQKVTAEREKWEAEKKEILSAVARGERLSEELRIDGPSLLEQERQKAAKLVEALEFVLSVLSEYSFRNIKDRIRQSLTEYKKQEVNALTNSNESPGSNQE